MKRFNKAIRTLPALVLAAGVAFGQADKIRLAVTPFDDSASEISESNKDGAKATGLMMSSLKSAERFMVRDPDAVKNYLNNLTKAQLGMMDEQAVSERSKDLKVDYLAVGTVTKLGDGYEVDARVVNVNNWNIVFSQGMTGKSPADAFKEISWYIKNKFDEKYVKTRMTHSEDIPTVSVHEFKDFTTDAGKTGYSGAFAEILNSELGSYVLISTVERKFSRKLIEEKILEMAGVIENDESDQSLSASGVQYKLAGDVRTFEDVVCINYRLFNTGDKRVIFTGTYEIGGTKAVRPAARQLAGTVEDVLMNKIGTLKLNSNPTGAEVFIDGSSQGTTPVTVSLTRGSHRMSVKMSGYKTHEGTVTIEPRKVQEKTVTLQTVDMALLQKAMMLENQMKWQDAFNAYDEFIKQYNNSAAADIAYYRKGHVAMSNLGKPDIAIKTFNELLERYPEPMTRGEAYYGLIKAYQSQGNRDKARYFHKYLLEKYGETNAADEARDMKF